MNRNKLLRVFSLQNAFLLAVFALLVWLAVYLVRYDFLRISSLSIDGAYENTGVQEVTEVVTKTIDGNLLTVDIGAVRAAIEEIPWVKRARVTRTWPNQLNITIERHRPIAIWEDGRLVSEQGVLFFNNEEPIEFLISLPTFSGDPGAAETIVRFLPEFQSTLAPMGLILKHIEVSFRGSWSVIIDGDFDESVKIELGRLTPDNYPPERLQAVMDQFERIRTLMRGTPSYIDARYKNGFAAKLPQPKSKRAPVAPDAPIPLQVP